MSLTINTQVVIGISAYKLLNHKNEVHEVTKYNPDTGVPYQQKVLKTRTFWLGQEVEPNTTIDDLEYDLLKKHDLKVFRNNSREDDCVIVGKSIANLQPNDFFNSSCLDLNNSFQKVVELFNNMNATNQELKFYVISYVG